MADSSINIRFSEPQDHIQCESNLEQFPLHPNYSTSVKFRRRANLVVWGPCWGTLRAYKLGLGRFPDFSKIRSEKVIIPSEM